MLRQVDLSSRAAGALFLHSMPGRYEPLPAVMEEIRVHKIARIISLAPCSEIREKSPEYASAIDKGLLPCELVLSPVPDYSVPADATQFSATSASAADLLMRGQNVLVHCGAGRGRTGTLATAILRRLGFSDEEALRRVHGAGSAPETDEQRRLLLTLSGEGAEP